MTYDVIIEGTSYRLQLERQGSNWKCSLNGCELHVDAVIARPDVLSILIDGKAYEVKRERGLDETHLWVGSGRYLAEIRDPRSFRSRQAGAGDAAGPRKLVAPMPGKVVRVLVAENADVEIGQGVLVVEAMKMQNEIKSPKKGRVQKLHATEGTAVNAGDVLAIVE